MKPRNLSDACYSTKRILLSALRAAGVRLQVIRALICSSRAALLARISGRELCFRWQRTPAELSSCVTEEVLSRLPFHTYSSPSRPQRARFQQRPLSGRRQIDYTRAKVTQPPSSVASCSFHYSSSPD